MQEIRQTLRSLWRDKGFTAIAVAMLALGIGATTAIFSVVEATLLRSPYERPDRLFALEELAPKIASQYSVDGFPVNARHFDEWRKACSACRAMSLMYGSGANLTGDGPPERIRTLLVTHEFLSVLGVAPRLGRDIEPADDLPGAPLVILLTDSFWRRRFGADPAILGRDILLQGVPVTVIGVLPPDFGFVTGAFHGAFNLFPQNFEGLSPLRIPYAQVPVSGRFNFGAIVRLEDAATPEQAVSQMNAAIADFSREAGSEMFARLRPFQDAVMGTAGRGLWILLGAVGAVLLIVCVNLGNLMFVRAERRGREAAIRRALGATRFRLLAGMLREGVVLAACGGAAGLLVARWMLDILMASSSIDVPRLQEAQLDWNVLGFAFLITAGAGLLTSWLPAARLAGAAPQNALRESQSTSTMSGGRLRLRGALIAAEAALSATLLVVAGLLSLSFFRLMAVDKGFETERILSFDVALPGNAYDDQARTRFHEQALEQLAALPGVRGAALTSRLPLEGATYVDTIIPEGETFSTAAQLITNYRFVSPAYWDTMGVQMAAGRPFERSDGDRLVAVISEEAARKAWPGESALGKKFRGGPSDDVPFEVIGVVREVRTTGLDEKATPIAYIPHWLNPLPQASYVVRTAADPLALANAVRAVIGSLDAELPVTNLRTMDQILVKSVAQERFQTTLASAFGLTALLLASLGVFGVVSYATAHRTKEIGLRMALGAESRNVLAMTLGQGMRPILAGLLVGLLAAAALGRYLEGLLFEVDATEPLAFAGMAALLLGASLLACYVPARRAAQLDPMTALRHE